MIGIKTYVVQLKRAFVCGQKGKNFILELQGEKYFDL